MKRKVFCFLILLLLVCAPVFAASFSTPAVSYDVSVDVNFNNDKNVAVLHMKLDVLPNTIEVLVPGFEFDINKNNKQFIIYSYTKSKAIPSGPLMRLNYSNVTDNTTFTLTTVGATDITASGLIAIPSITGQIKLYYVQTDVKNTALETIGAGTDGIDDDGDAVINVIDVQKVTNGQK